MTHINTDVTEKRTLVSIILPAYNEETIIEKNIESLYNSFMSVERQYLWEVLLVNDGSSDKTGSIIDTLACTYIPPFNGARPYNKSKL